MNCSKIERKVYTSPRLKILNNSNIASNSIRPAQNSIPQGSVSFQGAGNTLAKRGMFAFRNLSDYMSDVSEITNAVIAAIGTGIIAPAIILVSPGKGDKEDKDKKFFQAIRQPLSAGLALAFQVPMTVFIMRFIDSLSYKYKLGIFKDDELGDLIPDKKYLKKSITAEEFSKMEAEFDDTSNGKSLRQQLEEEIQSKYKEGRIELSEEQLQREVEKRKTKFIKEKIVDNKRKKLIEAKATEIQNKHPKINDIDLVNEDYKNRVIEQMKPQYEAIEKNFKLSWFDKTIRVMGFSNKKIKELEDAQKKFTEDEGLKILKAKNPGLFNDYRQKIVKYVENKDKAAQKLFKGKKFWLSLFVNIFMVSASCYALNWAHPRLKEQIDKARHKEVSNTQQLSYDKKVEVK